MKKLSHFIIFLNAINFFAQQNYTGFIGKYPIELVADVHTGVTINAFYVYTAYDEPIKLEGNFQNGELTFFEKDVIGKKSARMIFQKFDSESDSVHGVWMDLKTNKKLNITLAKQNDLSIGIIQATAIDDKYFRIVTDYSNVSAIKIYQKKTDKLLQKFDVNCRYWGLHTFNLGDFNFDGITDFSIFESSFAGPNTSSLYFLCDPKTKTFFESHITGVSLEFDQKTKRITETNQCCAGSIITKSSYKLVKNEMVLVKEQCFRWSEKKQELVERELIECQ